jgi:ferredoxin
MPQITLIIAKIKKYILTTSHPVYFIYCHRIQLYLKKGGCGACEKICPMDICITDYIKNGQRVLSTECILCFECTNVCAKEALKATWGLDMGKQELLNMRESPTE